LLKSGIDFAAGEISDVLTEENLNTLFNVNVALRFDGNRYSVISQQA